MDLVSIFNTLTIKLRSLNSKSDLGSASNPHFLHNVEKEKAAHLMGRRIQAGVVDPSQPLTGIEPIDRKISVQTPVDHRDPAKTSVDEICGIIS